MKDINDPNVLKEYIGYLAELAESVLTHINITDNDYQSLFVESESLCKRVAESNKIPPSLKSELGKLKLPKIKGEFTFWSFLKMHRRLKMNYDNEFETKRRENILEYKDRLNNLLFLIEIKS